ncbi:MAG: hypothetical protein KAX16_03675 [Actinomycetia bacterium]|nr:hypothetical protein [Actinomycetes bacterium]
MRQKSYRVAIALAPGIIFLSFLIVLFTPSTRRVALWMLGENHPVEILTLVIALAGGIFGLSLAWRARKLEETNFVVVFYAAFSVTLLIIGMEEIAWGQQFFGFDTPAAWRAYNLQGETTFHNLSGVHGHTEIFRLVFGIGGLVGVWFSFYPYFRKIASPIVLLPWFVIIALHAGVDVYNDYIPLGKQFDYHVQRTSEFIELLIVISAFLYIALKSKMFSFTLKPSESFGER